MKSEDFRKLKVGMKVRISDKVLKNEGYYKFLEVYPNRVAPIIEVYFENYICLGEPSDHHRANWVFNDFEVELLDENKQLRLF